MQTKEKKKILLFFEFLKIGAFTFGGGYAMIPLIQKETVENNKWVSDDDILEVIAIAESTPGPISVNAATFIGYKVAGVMGAFFATLGLILPAFIIMFCLIKAIYTMAPDKKVSSMYVNKGALFTTVGWLFVTAIYAFYANNIANYNRFYGGLSNIAILMIWIYLISYVFVLGIAINTSYYEFEEEKECIKNFD